jgi:hypothetical protein
MTSNGPNRRNSPDGLIVPAILVPDGDPVPQEWLAQHPDAIRVRATLVPRQLPSAETETQSQPSSPRPDAPRGERDPHHGLDEHRSERDPFSRAGGPEPGSAGPGYDESGPVAAYLRMHEALAGVGKGHVRPTSEPVGHVAPGPAASEQAEENGDFEAQDSSDQEPA